MSMVRRVARGAVILLVAAVAAYYVQHSGKKPQQAAAPAPAVEVVEAAATSVEAPPATAQDSAPTEPAPATTSDNEAAVTATASGEAPAEPAMAQPTETASAAPAGDAPAETATAQAPEAVAAAAPEAAPDASAPATPEVATTAAATAEPAPASDTAPTPQPAATPCAPATINLSAKPGALLGITLLAPCQKDARVVISHAGLTFTDMTTSNGALFVDIPALESEAHVTARFTDGTEVSGGVSIPGMVQVRRFGVQWQGDDAFSVHAFEDGAAYGAPGHISADNPRSPALASDSSMGYLTTLGDTKAALPLFAQIYTYPADLERRPEITVEAAVDQKSCGRELLGETVTSMGGQTFVTDLGVTMPDCAAQAGYIVLKNLVPDLMIAPSQ